MDLPVIWYQVISDFHPAIGGFTLDPQVHLSSSVLVTYLKCT